MEQLRIYRIADQYVAYLRKIDGRVQHNKASVVPMSAWFFTWGNINTLSPWSRPNQTTYISSPESIL